MTPLEVVQQRPVQIAPDIDTVTDRLLQVLERLGCVRDAASIVPEDRPDAVDLDGSPAGALVVQVDGCTVAGLVDGATTVVVTSTGTGRPGVRLAG